MYGWLYVVPVYLARIQGYNAQQIGGVLIWIGLPQLVILPIIPRVMKVVDPRLLVVAGFILFIAGSLMAANLSGNFSGPQFIYSSLVRATAQSLVMTPLSSIAVAGIQRENAGSAAALFNMIRNLGGAIGIAVLQTVMTQREHFHSDVLTAQVSMLGEATRGRLTQLTGFFATHVSDPAVARHEAIIATGRLLHRQASMQAFADTIIFQSALLGVALVLVLLLKKPNAGGSAVEAH